MTDDELTDLWEAGTVFRGGISHRDHLRIAWVLHARHGPDAARTRLLHGTRRACEVHGCPEKFDPALTERWARLIASLIEQDGLRASAGEFIAAHPDLRTGRLAPMPFETPTDLKFNRGPIADPDAFARDADAASWLFLCGEEFASMEGGLSYERVKAAVPESVNVVSDPPEVLDMDHARRQVAALDELPRPTLVTCRVGPRSSAAVYLYAGLRAGATADEVLARAEADDAPFARSDELRAWVAQGLDELS